MSFSAATGAAPWRNQDVVKRRCGYRNWNWARLSLIRKLLMQPPRGSAALAATQQARSYCGDESKTCDNSKLIVGGEEGWVGCKTASACQNDAEHDADRASDNGRDNESDADTLVSTVLAVRALHHMCIRRREKTLSTHSHRYLAQEAQRCTCTGTDSELDFGGSDYFTKIRILTGASPLEGVTHPVLSATTE